VKNATIHSLSYWDDFIHHYQALNHLPGFVLLESSDKERGRYDIVSAMPYDELVVMREEVDHTVFDRLQNKLATIPSTLNLPFQGGGIGYIAYDLGAILAGIYSPPHPLLSKMPLIDMQFYDWAIVVDHQLKQVHLIATHRVPETADLMPEILQLWEHPSFSTKPFKLHDTFAPILSKEAYQRSFRAIHQELIKGRAYQANYTQPFIAEYSGDVWEMYKCVRKKNPVPFAAFLSKADFQILSFSPERFLTMEKGRISASPIKGTAKRHNDPNVDEYLRQMLKSSAKDHAENVMIVDLLRNDLGKFAHPGSVHVPILCELMSFNAVHHLVSHIEATCDETISTVQAFAACFPGGSITGAPKLEAMRIIAEQEKLARGVYCGSIGYFSHHGRFDTNIAIRTVTATQNSLYLPAGGGIVIDSSWEEEYHECLTKIAGIVESTHALIN
jgi:para-aminobenzoate synthetase component 1